VPGGLPRFRGAKIRECAGERYYAGPPVAVWQSICGLRTLWGREIGLSGKNTVLLRLRYTKGCWHHEFGEPREASPSVIRSHVINEFEPFADTW